MRRVKSLIPMISNDSLRFTGVRAELSNGVHKRGGRFHIGFAFAAAALVTAMHFAATTALAGDIVYWESDYAFAKAQLGSTVRTNSHAFSSGSKYGDLVNISSSGLSLAQSTANLRFSNSNTGLNSSIQFSTFGNPQSNSSGYAQMYTSTQPAPYSGYEYIYFYVRPTYNGEYFGKPVTITLKAHATGTISYPDNVGYNSYSVYGPNGRFLDGRDTRTRVNQATTTVSTRMGDWVAVAMQGASVGTKNKAAAQLQLTLDISAR